MKKIFLTLTALFLLAGCSQTKDKEKIQVVTSFYPLYDFATKIGGDQVEVTNLLGSGQDAHGYEPSPKDIAKIEESDVFIYHGAGFDSWATKVTKNLTNKEVEIVEASHNVSLLGNEEDHDHDHDHENVGEHDHEDGHDHGAQDPHTWLSLKNAQIEMQAIRDAFVKVDPQNEALYNQNFDKYEEEFTKLNNEFEGTLKAKENRTFMVDHKAFAYLAHDYDLQQEGIVQGFLSTEPSQKELELAIQHIREDQTSAIFMSNSNSKISDTIKKETNVEVYRLYTMETMTKKDLEEGNDYFSMMRHNLQVLTEGL